MALPENTPNEAAAAKVEVDFRKRRRFMLDIEILSIRDCRTERAWTDPKLQPVFIINGLSAFVQ